MFIEKVTSLTDEIISAVERLVPFLGTHKGLPTREEITALVASESSTLFVAHSGAEETSPIVGMLCVSIYRVPTGLRSIIEDVVVDQAARGQGIGETLMKTAIEFAKANGANNVSLTSNPMRESANRLYMRVGFKKRETNAYEIKF